MIRIWVPKNYLLYKMAEEIKPRDDAPLGNDVFTIEIIIDSIGRCDLLKRIHDRDITVIPEVKEILIENKI